MPGTIQVSVVEFQGLPSTFLKVSLGKREYQTSDTGDFSFPLTTLRDNLVVRLLDAEGNEIALTDIQTMSIVKKVSWDEIFPLDGGGHVHLKLQFILNEDERNRIRLKREAAVKKKQETIPNISNKSPEVASSVGSPVTLPLLEEQKVSDSQTRTVLRVASDNVAMLASLLPNPDVSPAGLQSNYGRDEGSILQQTIPKATDDREGIFSASKIRGTEAHQIAFEEKLETQPSVPKADVNLVKESSSDSLNTGSDVSEKSSSASLRLEFDHVDKSQQQGLLQKSPSKVRKLVGAFESSLPKQDMKSAVIAPTVGSEPKKVGKGGHLKDFDPKDVTKPAEPSSGRHGKPFVAGDSKPTLATSSKRGEGVEPDQSYSRNILYKETETSEQSSVEAIRPVEKELGTNEWIESPVQLERSSTTETASTSGRMHTHQYGRAYSFKLYSEKQYSGGTSYAEGRGKRVMNLLGNGPTEAKFHQKKKGSSSAGDTREHGSDYEMKKHQKESYSPRKSKSDSSSKNASGGFVGQVIKVGMIMGFGALVFFTRQREPRKSKRDANELFFPTSDYMDEHTSIAEEVD